MSEVAHQEDFMFKWSHSEFYGITVLCFGCQLLHRIAGKPTVHTKTKYKTFLVRVGIPKLDHKYTSVWVIQTGISPSPTLRYWHSSTWKTFRSSIYLKLYHLIWCSAFHCDCVSIILLRVTMGFQNYVFLHVRHPHGSLLRIFVNNEM